MKWLERCLNSCSGYNVVVIDNASTDHTVTYIKEHHPNVHLIQSDENLGFGKANNIGMSYALSKNADAVFLLNQDAYLVDNVLETLFTFQSEHKEYGILSPIHLNGTETAMDFYFSNYVSNTKNADFYSDHVTGQPLKPVYEVPFVNAAAWLISKTCLEKVGGFDPLFFHYSEDNNYCQRVRFHNFKIGVVPKVFVIHDRKQVKQKKMKPYSSQYFTWKERIYKTTFADVNSKDPKFQINKELRVIKKNIAKALFSLNFKVVKGQLIQQKNLKQLIPEILKSYNNNKVEGAHYL